MESPIVPKSLALPTEWRWYAGVSFAIQWEMCFQAGPDLLEEWEKLDFFWARRVSRLQMSPDKKSMICAAWYPKVYGAVDADSVTKLDRKMFQWVKMANGAASEDWDKTWTEKTSPILEVKEQEVDPEELAAEARAKQILAKQLKKGPQSIIRG